MFVFFRSFQSRIFSAVFVVIFFFIFFARLSGDAAMAAMARRLKWPDPAGFP